MPNLIYKNEKGMVLPLGLMFLAIIAIIGTTAVIVTTTDLKIGDNYRASEQAFCAAEAGIEEARARLKGSSSTNTNYVGDPSSPNPLWSVYMSDDGSLDPSSIDPDFNSSYTNTSVSSLQTDISYLVKIRHKREYEAEVAGHTTSSQHYYDGDGDTNANSFESQGSIVYYGYEDPSQPSTPAQFTTAAATEHKPVEIITCCGLSDDSIKAIEVEVVRNPGPKINSALYAKGNVTGNGTSVSIDGTDNCGEAPAKESIYTLSPSTTTLNGHPTLTPPETSGTDDFDIAIVVDSMKASATEIITADTTSTDTFGGPANFVTCFSDTEDPHNVQGLKMTSSIGYGILLVEGDLTLSGTFEWYGLIVVTGTLVLNGGGTGVNIHGAVLANNTVDMNGNIDIKYDSCMVDNSLNNQSLDIISWKEFY